MCEDSQLGLFNAAVQRNEMARVNSKLQKHIFDFVESLRRRGTHDFRMIDLVSYVSSKVPEAAPESAGRILRDLKQKGLIKYRCASRRNSLYRLE